jgi:hypothetical protein
MSNSTLCLEEKNCQIIRGVNKDYSNDFHEEIKGQLDIDFEKRLTELKRE